MRTLLLCVVLGAFTASGTLAGEKVYERTGLFSKADESPLTVSTSLWFSRGETRLDASGTRARFENDSNMMGLLDVRVSLPRYPWISIQGRFGVTLSDSGGEINNVDDCDGDFTWFELNGAVALAGHGSPIAPNHDMVRTYVEAFAGFRIFKEEFDCDTDLGGLAVEDRWFMFQLGIRGEWMLSDTYKTSEGAIGWSLIGDFTLMPWGMLDGEADLDGSTLFEDEADNAYGLAGSVGVRYRFRSFTFCLGHSWQVFRTDSGDHDQDGAGDSLALQESSRKGWFLGATLHF
jgi:hypothetical protein